MFIISFDNSSLFVHIRYFKPLCPINSTPLPTKPRHWVDFGWPFQRGRFPSAANIDAQTRRRHQAKFYRLIRPPFNYRLFSRKLLLFLLVKTDFTTWTPLFVAAQQQFTPPLRRFLFAAKFPLGWEGAVQKGSNFSFESRPSRISGKINDPDDVLEFTPYWSTQNWLGIMRMRPAENVDLVMLSGSLYRMERRSGRIVQWSKFLKGWMQM